MASNHPAYPHLGAFESTRLIGTPTDILGTTRHIERWHYDLNLLREAGIRELRYSAPWHRIEVAPGEFDFSWFDGPLAEMEATGMRPILDPLHHVSFPGWLDEGFANPHFPDLYARFVVELARRYPWVDRYTIFNEPLPTTLFCSLNGLWYPHHASDLHFARMVLSSGRAICLASEALSREVADVEFIHVETAESHRSQDRDSEGWVEFANERRFLLHDLMLGWVDGQHPLLAYLETHGVSRNELRWFEDHPARIDVLGLDYYMHSEMDWYWDKDLGRANIASRLGRPKGFREVAQLYSQRFQLPIMLTETNLRGTYRDRITWLKFMEEQCEGLAGETDFRGFCWYPSIDSTDWAHLCRKATGEVDPQGIWGLDCDRWERVESELSQLYGGLCKGELRSQDLPAYQFSPLAGPAVNSYRPLMSHWPDWKSQA